MTEIQVGDRVVCNSPFDSDASPANAEERLRGVIGVVQSVSKHDARVKYPDGVWSCIPSLPLDTLALAERSAGFRPKPGCGPCATGGFSGTVGFWGKGERISGRITYR